MRELESILAKPRTHLCTAPDGDRVLCLVVLSGEGKELTMMFMAKFVFPLLGALLFLLAGSMWWKFVGLPLPVHVAMTIGVMAIVGAAAFVGSALAWWEDA